LIFLNKGAWENTVVITREILIGRYFQNEARTQLSYVAYNAGGFDAAEIRLLYERPSDFFTGVPLPEI
jgi:hypothetical protein